MDKNLIHKKSNYKPINTRLDSFEWTLQAFDEAIKADTYSFIL